MHLIQRGHNRDACFFGDEDYTLYLSQLAELSTKLARLSGFAGCEGIK